MIFSNCSASGYGVADLGVSGVGQRSFMFDTVRYVSYQSSCVYWPGLDNKQSKPQGEVVTYSAMHQPAVACPSQLLRSTSYSLEYLRLVCGNVPADAGVNSLPIGAFAFCVSLIADP